MTLPPPLIKFKIVYQDNDIIVIDKPAGLIRPGIVHRLDKDTSGLMVVAKNDRVFECLKRQFQERKVVKKYLALVHGRVKNNKGIITKVIGFSGKNHLKRSALLGKRAKSAWTEYQVIKRFKEYTFLEVYPKTGRTHQIRVHLASIGHPIVGDRQYKFKRQPLPEGLTRQFLHATVLKFKSPSGKIMEFKSELTNELKEILSNLDA